MFTIIVAFVTATAQGELQLDQHYASLQLCEAARPAAVEEFRLHVEQHGTTVVSSMCSINGIGGEPIFSS